jgi:hypothetical protein
VRASQVAQAAEFIRALHFHLRKMISDLARVECHYVAGRSSRQMRLETTALRHDIAEAKILIDRLQRFCLSTN